MEFWQSMVESIPMTVRIFNPLEERKQSGGGNFEERARSVASYFGGYHVGGECAVGLAGILARQTQQV